jgi:hypothetical protein
LGITRQLLRPRDLSGPGSRQVEPHVCADHILRYTVAKGIHPTESELRDGETLISGAAKPLRSLAVVLRHNLAELVQSTENVLRKGAALVGVLMKTREVPGGRVSGSAVRSFKIVDWFSSDSSSKCRH